MFKNILVTFVTPSSTGHTAEVAFEMAKKFGSKIIFLKCIVEAPPKFGFFSSKRQQEEHDEKLGQAKESLADLEKTSKELGVPVETDVGSTESLEDFLLSYIENKKVDLLIVDSHSIDEVQKETHKLIVNKIYTKIACPILTLN